MKWGDVMRLLLVAALYIAHDLLAQRLAGLDPIAQVLVAQDIAVLAQLGVALLLRVLCVVVVPALLAAWAMSRALRWYAGKQAESRYNSPPS